jgi:hypothetical protein|nr:MAG TPA: helix-turn-helix domain-containing protein [Caudoviricetes sp.]
MKSVLISIKPTWCAKITSGEKTVEVRRTRPNLDAPFLCHIYCTNVKSMPLDLYVKLHQQTGGAVDEWSGKVFGSFICNKIDNIKPANEPYGTYDIDDDYVARTCLLYGDMWNYGKGKPLFGWNISDFQLCDIPLELGMFEITRPPQSWCYVEGGAAL